MSPSPLSSRCRPLDEHDHVQGSPDATLTLVEYGDYECPSCASAHELVRDLQEELGPSLRYAFRYFPLSAEHPCAELAAATAEAAALAGHFWQMHDLLFAHRSRLEPCDLLTCAVEIGLDAEDVLEQLAAGVHAARVKEDVESGLASGVAGTPTFFVNGVRYDGAFARAELAAALHATRRA